MHDHEKCGEEILVILVSFTCLKKHDEGACSEHVNKGLHFKLLRCQDSLPSILLSF